MLFATDLDGTLLLPQVPGCDARIEEGLMKALAAGHELVFITGRNYQELYNEKAIWQMPAYIIGMNGSIILDKQRRIIYQNVLDKDIVKKIFDEYHDLPFEYIAFDQKMVTVDKKTFREHFQSCFPPNFFADQQMQRFMDMFLQTNSYETKQEHLLSKAIFKIELMSHDRDFCQRIANELYQWYPDKLTCYLTENSLVICCCYIDKAESLALLCEHLQIADDQVHVFGDGHNDVSMLKKYENSYAVANGSEEAKNAAKHLIGENVAYGVIEKIEQLMGQD